MKKRGFFITFEGIEGAGKTTQLEKIYRALRRKNIPTVKTFEPGDGIFGKKIRSLVVGNFKNKIGIETELFLFLSDRAQHVKDVILPSLRKGKIVLCDRFTDSTMAYQGFGRGLPIQLLEGMNKLATGGLKPDLTFFLDLPVKEGLKRIKKRGSKNRLDREALSFYERVRQGYYRLARYNNKRMKILNALTPSEKLHEQILAMVNALLKGNIGNAKYK
jgi:dTMP kinase